MKVAEPRRITLRDTTLREGIQMPGSRISLDQKREFVALLDRAGVPEIEIGLPDGLSACLEVAGVVREMGLSLRTTALIPFYTSRWKHQIDQASQNAIDRIDILGPTSDFLLGDVSLYGMSPAEILPRLESVVEYACQRPIQVGVGLIDATRTPWDRLEPILQKIGVTGASRVVIYDSVGIMTPPAMKTLVEKICAAVRIPVLVHCHNDYGMATANSLAAVEGGADAVDVAVNGVGGRAGNAALEEVVLALHNLYGHSTGIDSRCLSELSTAAERITGVAVAPTKPIVGRFCFAHLPVMHIRCIAGGNPAAFEPYPPEQVGAQRTYGFSLPVDYSAALEPFLRKSGCRLSAEEVGQLLDLLKAGEGFTEAEVLNMIRDFSKQVHP